MNTLHTRRKSGSLVWKSLTLVVPCALFLVFGMWLSHSFAAEPLPEAVENALVAIRANQQYIEKNRPIVEEFERRKTNNAVQTGIMEAYCFEFNWGSMKPTKKGDCNSRPQ